MHAVTLPVPRPVTDVPPLRSPLGFGTASLHRLASRSRRQRLLHAALEAGITHFDTAPLYGHGLAECELGELLATHRQDVTVATKVGLYPPDGAHSRLLSVVSRKLLGRAFPRLSQPVVDWAVARADGSLRQSLRRMRTDHVDLLLLHEPQLSLVQADEMLAWLERVQADGRVLAFGVAGERACVEPMVAAAHPLAQVVQTRDSLARREADFMLRAGRQPQVAYGYLHAERTQPASAVPRPARDILAEARRLRPGTCILVSTLQQAHLRQWQDAVA